MKRSLVLFVMFFFSLVSSGQKLHVLPDQKLNHTIHASGDFSVSLIAPNVLFDSNEGSLPGAGLKLRLFVGKRFSFDSDLVIGRDFLRFGPGVIGLPLWLIATGPGLNFNNDSEEKESFTGFLLMGAIMVLSGEHFAYHIPAGASTDISPYLSVLRFKSVKSDQALSTQDENAASANCAVGIELNKYVGRFVLSPFADYEVAYNGSGHGFNVGFSVGYNFRAK